MSATSAQLRVAGALVAVAIVAGLGFAYYHSRSSVDELAFYGNVDIREVTLGFRVAGRVDTLAVDEGDSVKEGQVLATLDSDPLRRELNEAKANAHAIESRLALFRSGYRKEDVASAQAVLAERQAGLTNAEQTLTRLSELRLAKGWTRAELATRSGVPLRSLTKYETGKGKPYGDNRAKLVKTLGIEPEELR